MNTLPMQGFRFYFMDAVRSSLMLLSVILHAAQVYNPEHAWLIYGTRNSDLAYYLVHLIHTFSMPAFFVVSGFFCVLSIDKYQPAKFIIIRLKRILIPFITTAFFINSLEALLLSKTGWLSLDLSHYFSQGAYIVHLWFLTNLCIYFLLAALVATLLKKPLPAKLHIPNCIPQLPFSLILLLLPISSFAILGLNRVGFPLYANFYGVFDIYAICRYLPYFLFGVVLALNKSLFQQFTLYKPLWTLSLLLFANLLLQHLELFPEHLRRFILAYFHDLTQWLSVSLFFFIFYTCFNSPSKNWHFIADASYSVYLLHHVCIIAMGLLLIKLQFPALLSITLITSLTLLITLSFHYFFILRVSVLRLLLNGRR